MARESRRCKCVCNRELPSRYKGRQREFYMVECRKVYRGEPLTKKEEERWLTDRKSLWE